jgi:thiamine biosynthesis lipoprotein
MSGARIEVRSLFRAMNTDVEALVVAGPDQAEAASEALELVEHLFHQHEAVLSRFLPGSELSLLNASAGRTFHASQLLYTVVEGALDAAEATSGVFDPTILGSLIAAGYDRSFETLDLEQAETTLPIRKRTTWREVQLRRAERAIFMPAGCSLDLGGIGKGWTLDQAARLLEQFADFAIDAGGDIVLAGTPVDGGAWSIGVQDPYAPERDLMQLQRSDCAVATSTCVRRRWLRGGRSQHHLIDPRTGLPSASGAIAATVIAPSAAQAETLAKAAVVLGPGSGLRLLQREPEVEGLIVLDGGYVQTTEGLRGLQRVA